MKLPNGDRAVVPIEKLRDYALNPAHAARGDKAAGFWRALRLRQSNALALQALIRDSAARDDAVRFGFNAYGELFTIDATITWRGRSAVVRTGWIVRHEEDFPRLVTAFVVTHAERRNDQD